MNLLLLAVGKPPKSAPYQHLLRDYLQRASRYAPCELLHPSSEAALLADIERRSGRTSVWLALADSRGTAMDSAEFAQAIKTQRDLGTQCLALAIGPPDGWSPAALRRANLSISFGRITLPHELAAVVAAEQLYRVLTILAGHPYHSGH